MKAVILGAFSVLLAFLIESTTISYKNMAEGDIQRFEAMIEEAKGENWSMQGFSGRPDAATASRNQLADLAAACQGLPGDFDEVVGILSRPAVVSPEPVIRPAVAKDQQSIASFRKVRRNTPRPNST